LRRCHSLPTGTNRLVNLEHSQVGRDIKKPDARGPATLNRPITFRMRRKFATVSNVPSCMEGFVFPGQTGEDKAVIRRQLHHYVMAFDTGIAPAVGRQLTFAGEFLKGERPLLDLLMAQSAAGNCDLIALGWERNVQRGWLYADGVYRGDRSDETPLALDALLGRYRQPGEPITFTCVPPGDGLRSALDRNFDGILNRDELFAGGGFADPKSGRSLGRFSR
jgi:hypothetical protein